MKRYVIMSLALISLCGCSITSRLEKKQTRAEIKFIPKENAKKPYKDKKPIEIKNDTSKVLIVPTTIDDNGESIISMEMEEVVVVAKLCVLPERKGKVSIDFMITIPKELQGNCQNVVVTPYLHKSDKIEVLKDLSIRGGLFTKVQGRNYWQFEQYVKMFKPNAMQEQQAFDRFIKYPYPKEVRLDSIVENSKELTYYYKQEVSTKGEGSKMLITLQGRVVGLDGSYYKLPTSDTLEYNISSMINFIDTTPRYISKVVEKYTKVNDKNYLSFPVGKTMIIDSLKENKYQLENIENLMQNFIEQKEFYVDSISLTAGASPEGSDSMNNILAKGRANALKNRLIQKFGKDIDKLIVVRWIAEDWEELYRLILSSNIEQASKIIETLKKEINHDKRELLLKNKYSKEYKRIKSELYPQLRYVAFQYNLRRIGMVKDTIITTELDSAYLNGIHLLEKRKYNEALNILEQYKDHNTALTKMSLGYDEDAYRILSSITQNDKTYYLRAIVCSRLGLKDEGVECYKKACELNSVMEFRGKLDPEIMNLIKDD